MALWRKKINFLGDIVKSMQPYMVCVSWMILRHITDEQRDELRDIGMLSNITSIKATPEIRMQDVFWEVDRAQYRVEGGVENLYSTIQQENDIKSMDDLVGAMYASLFRKRPNMVCEGDEDDDEQTMTDNQREEDSEDGIFTDEEEEHVEKKKQSTIKKSPPKKSPTKPSSANKRKSLEQTTIDVLQSMEKRKQLFAPSMPLMTSGPAIPPPVPSGMQQRQNHMVMGMQPNVMHTKMMVEEEYEVCLVPGGNAVDVQSFTDAVKTWNHLGFSTPSYVSINKDKALYEKNVPVDRLMKYSEVKREYYKAKRRVDELRFMVI